MGRLIDADALQEMRFSNGLNEDGVLYVPFGEVMRNIRNAPKAYDVEKVVAELEKERHPEICGGWETMRIEKAIDIVKRGGVE